MYVRISTVPLQPESDQFLGLPLDHFPLAAFMSDGKSLWSIIEMGQIELVRLWVRGLRATGWSVINEARIPTAPAAPTAPTAPAAHLSVMFMEWLTAFVAPAIG